MTRVSCSSDTWFWSRNTRRPSLYHVTYKIRQILDIELYIRLIKTLSKLQDAILYNVWFISYSKCSNWHQISKLSWELWIFIYFLLFGWGSIKTDLHTCNLLTGQFLSYKSGILFHIKCLSQKLQKCIYSNLQPGCLVVRRLSTFTYWCIKMNRSSLNFSPSNQYIFLLFFCSLLTSE